MVLNRSAMDLIGLKNNCKYIIKAIKTPIETCSENISPDPYQINKPSPIDVNNSITGK